MKIFSVRISRDTVANQLARTEGIERLACWTHVQRRYVDAVKVPPKGKRGRADEAVALIGKLYRIERDHKDSDDKARLLARQELSVPVLAELPAWLTKTQPAVTPKSALGTAVSYMRDYWSMLTRYTERGDLPIDNNIAHAASGMTGVVDQGLAAVIEEARERPQ